MFAIHYLLAANSLLLADWNGAAVYGLSLDSGATHQVVHDASLRNVNGFAEDAAGVMGLTSSGMVRLHLESLEPLVAKVAQVEACAAKAVLEGQEFRPCTVVCHEGFLQVYESRAMRNEFACEEFELKYAYSSEHGQQFVDLASMDSRICYRHWSTMVNPRLTVLQFQDQRAVIIGTLMGLYQLNLFKEDPDSNKLIAGCGSIDLDNPLVPSGFDFRTIDQSEEADVSTDDLGISRISCVDNVLANELWVVLGHEIRIYSYDH